MPSTAEQDGMSSFLVNIRLTGHYIEVFEKLTSACISKFHEKPCYYLLIIYIKMFEMALLYHIIQC